MGDDTLGDIGPNEVTTTADFTRRFELALAALDEETSTPNCRGTVLFWIGARNKAYFAWSHDLEAVIDRDYKITKDPKIGDIAVWCNPNGRPKILHAGLVSKIEGNIFVKSRLGAEIGSPILELPVDEVFNDQPAQLIYYTKS
ncbi:hypothetical protein IPG41_01940 [Candidatus Peregrinibacteria bacterium]|nr:MAG: hypothetical protein IPG41_01940 [Candidatus Peregrinibacteria bacterium]